VQVQADASEYEYVAGVSETRNLEATPRRIARARARFGRPASGELTAAVALAAAAVALPGAAAVLVAALASLWKVAIAGAGIPQLHDLSGRALAPAQSNALTLLAHGSQLAELAQVIAALLIAIALTAALVTALQRGAFVRIAAGAGSTFESRIPPEPVAARLARSAMSVAKWAVFVAALVAPWSEAVRGMMGAWQRTPSELLPLAGRLVLALLERAAIVLAVLGVVDFGVQQVAFRRRLRMSRRELQEEQKATESDPHATAERKRRMRELQAEVALRELEEVTMLVCDVEGRAFGVREHGREVAVWIKAEGEVAARVRTEAEARGLPIRVDRDLSGVLARGEIGEALPEAVAARLRSDRG
jgi:flagellar biosynthetic protein FlhB